MARRDRQGIPLTEYFFVRWRLPGLFGKTPPNRVCDLGYGNGSIVFVAPELQDRATDIGVPEALASIL